MDAIKKWMLSYLLSTLHVFLVRQLKKFMTDLNWDLLKKDFMERAAKLMPGEMFDEWARTLVAVMLDKAKEELDKHPNLPEDLWAMIEKLLQDVLMSEAVQMAFAADKK